MKNRYAVILAAGQGSRMKSSLYKVLHPVAGKAMVEHVVGQVEKLNVAEIVTIVGFGAEMVKEQLGERSHYALQTEQLGTGHAVLAASEQLAGKEGTTLVICGDTPLLQADTLEELFAHHETMNAKATILSAIAKDPTGYGRVIRNSEGHVEKIVEHKDANEQELAVTEFNTGTYCFDNKSLFEALNQVGNENAQGEYYLPDVIGILKAQGETVSAYIMDSEDDSMGVNDRVALAKANQLMFERINLNHMREGVSFVSPATTYIEADVTIGRDTTIEAGVQLKGQTVIGENCFLGANSEIIDSQIGNDVEVKSSTIESSVIKDFVDVGPYAHIRPNTTIENHAHIGNFVETKNTIVGEGTKVGHLTYVGDGILGKHINIGAGTIFANYDGKNKFKTTIGDYAFIGSNTTLIAPVTLGERSAIAAGSTINQDVPDYDLGIARGRQSNLKEYSKKMPYNQ